MKGINEEMDYIYDWTTSTDLKKRKKKKIEKKKIWNRIIMIN